MKNPPNIETVSHAKHAKLRLKPNADWGHAKGTHLAGITLSELSATAGNFPIVFIRTPDNKNYHPVAMLGLRPGENHYYNADGWDSTYVPLMIQRHPFLIGFDDSKPEDSRELTACVNRNSPFLSENADEGIALFKEDGGETDLLLTVHRLLKDIFDSERLTEQFTTKLMELDLFSPFELILQPQNAEPRKVTGMYTINENKMRALTPEQVQELHKLDFLPPAYIMMGSLYQLNTLLKLRNKKSEEKIVDFRIELDPKPAPAAAQ
ncbi:MAG: SapC family protein [Pseudomonadota bacterium]